MKKIIDKLPPQTLTQDQLRAITGGGKGGGALPGPKAYEYNANYAANRDYRK